jgi:hypothetical protein
MMRKESSEVTPAITVFGNGAYYAERAGDVGRYAATRDVRIGKAELICPQDQLLDIGDLLIQHAPAIQQLARRHIAHLQIVMLPGSIDEPLDETLIAEIIETASGWHLLRALDGACHGYPVGEPGTDIEDGFMPRVAASAQVQQVLQVLQAGGVRVIRFMDAADGLAGEELGPFYFILDQSVLRQPQPEAHFGLQFGDYPTAEQAEAAQVLNREWLLLDEAGRGGIQTVVGLCRRSDKRATLPFGDGGAYAYPHPGGGIAWGLERRHGVIARGVQRLPADEGPTITELGDLRAIAESWRRLGDLAAEARDPSRAKDLLAAAGWHHAAAGYWLQAAALNDAELTEGQAHLDVIAASLEQVRGVVEASCADPAWLSGFDAAGWPNVPRHSVALTLSAFMLQLYEGRAAQEQSQGPSDRDNAAEQGRSR